MLRAEGISLANRVSDLSIDLISSDAVHLLGPNGSGKSSLLNLLAGLIAPDKGNLWLDGRDLTHYAPAELASQRCLMEQSQQSVFALTVKESLNFFCAERAVPESLEQALNIADFMQRPLNQLSGGEQRRVQIARCLMQVWPAIEQGRALLLLDEPVQGLDFSHQHRLCALLNRLTQMGNMLVMSHHQLNLAERYASRIWLMHQGQLVADDVPEQVLTEPLLTQVFSCNVRIVTDTEQNRLIQTYL
ncbi:ATP-binding cassette domain-containing protein [Lacimicrobium alkaliphilum]|uniref:Vitamin B12 import ATP-binding protein BtuD n=1 Tax=Lacimicrobium alkaliphilum TaxID=1526571 RepID=A0ABQ1R1H9_9ALTE|nr:ATP-binding cassette domain-containing protein [Lacimicrobium alkaliphilum]GGD52903.1 vitamin B12 import ATP-binding protein BtuD [Lacimicrobium alkaliphilum]